MLLKVLEQADNSNSAFDDSFYTSNLLECIGRLDNFRIMPEIACEILRYLKLDLITKSSPHFCITISAVKAYFNLRA